MCKLIFAAAVLVFLSALFLVWTTARMAGIISQREELEKLNANPNSKSTTCQG